SESRATALWPDGSVKWLFVDFTHDFSRSGAGDYQIAYGNVVRPIAAAATVRLQETPSGIEVDSGTLKLVVPKRPFGNIENDRGHVAVDVTETSGRVWHAQDVPVEKLWIEQRGRQHVVIVAETRRPESGNPSQGFFHRAAIHVYAGSPLVDVDYFIANTDQ